MNNGLHRILSVMYAFANDVLGLSRKPKSARGAPNISKDILQYLYFSHGKAFSLLDWQRGHGKVEIELPSDIEPWVGLVARPSSRPQIQLNDTKPMKQRVPKHREIRKG